MWESEKAATQWHKISVNLRDFNCRMRNCANENGWVITGTTFCFSSANKPCVDGGANKMLTKYM
jgi:hypothetical protein